MGRKRGSSKTPLTFEVVEGPEMTNDELESLAALLASWIVRDREKRIMEQNCIVEKLRAEFGQGISLQTPFPAPYYKDKSKVKAIYLGCDPSNKRSNTLPFAFALESGIPVFDKFIQDHEENLKQVGLTWDDVYVQNLCQNYFEKETSKNLTLWKKVAAWWIPRLKVELSIFGQNIPVLLTSAYLYNVLVPGTKFKPVDFYTCKQPIPIPPSQNLLERPLIPFYRNRRKVDYHLSNGRWAPYRESVKDLLRI